MSRAYPAVEAHASAQRLSEAATPEALCMLLQAAAAALTRWWSTPPPARPGHGAGSATIIEYHTLMPDSRGQFIAAQGLVCPAQRPKHA